VTGDPRGFCTAGTHGAWLSVHGWGLGLGVGYDGWLSEHRRDLYYAARALVADEVERAQAAHPIARDRPPTLGTRTRHTVGVA
jgi:hypothetical protein